MIIETKFTPGDEVYIDDKRFKIFGVNVRVGLMMARTEVVVDTEYMLQGSLNTYTEKEMKSVQEYRDHLSLVVNTLDEELERIIN